MKIKIMWNFERVIFIKFEYICRGRAYNHTNNTKGGIIILLTDKIFNSF